MIGPHRQLQPRTTGTLTVIAAFTVVAVVWGTTPFTIKTGLNAGWDPLWFCGFRLLFAAAVCAPLLLTRFGGKPLGRAGRRAVLPMGVFGIALNFGLTVWGQQYIGAGLASLIAGTQPVTTTLIARYATHQPMTMRFTAGLVLGVGGLIAIFGGDAGASSPAILGAVAVFVGCTIYSAIFVYISARITGLSPVRVVATQNLIGGVLVALSALLIEGRAQLPRSVDGYLAVGYLAVISSVVALTLAIWLIGTMGAPRFSLMSFVTPVIGVTVGVTWLDESLQAGMVVGGGLIAVSLTLSLRSGSARSTAVERR